VCLLFYIVDDCSRPYSPWSSVTSRTALASSSLSIFLGMVLILLDSTGSASNLGHFNFGAVFEDQGTAR